MTVAYGASAYDVELQEYGRLTVGNMGCVHNITVNSKCELSVVNGGIINGTLYIADGAYVSVTSSSIIDFTVADRSVEDNYLLNNLSLIKGTPTYTITVSTDQEYGTYKLAQGAENFTGSITIGDGSVNYGSITVNGEEFVYNDVSYSLVQSDGNLTLTVGKFEPVILPSVFIYDGGTLTSSGTVINGGTLVFSGNDSMYVYDGGVANGVYASDGGRIYVSGGTVNDITLFCLDLGNEEKTAEMYIYNGTANNTVVEDYCNLYVSGGLANNTTVHGSMYVYDGGIADGTLLQEGSLEIIRGGIANNTVINNGYMYIIDGIANNTVVEDYCNLYVSGGIANDTIIVHGNIYIYDGGIANNTELSSGGSVYVDNGGVASGVTVCSGGSMIVVSGGIVSDVNAQKGAVVWVSGGGSAVNINADAETDFVFEITSDTYINGVKGDSSFNIAGGSASSFNVADGDVINVFDGGIAMSNTLENWGHMDVSAGGSAYATEIGSGGYLDVYSGGSVLSAQVNSSGRIGVYKGASATGLVIEEGGRYGFYVDSETYIQMQYAGSEWNTISDGLVSGFIVKEEGFIDVCSGASAIDVTVSGAYASLNIYGGAAHNITVHSGGIIRLSGVGNDLVINNGGSMTVYENGSAAVVYNPWQGTVDASSGAVVIYLERDRNIYYGGAASGLISKWDNISDFEITSGNSMLIYSGGEYSGTMQINDGGTVYVEADGIIDFTVADRSVDDGYLINDVSLIKGTPTYTITVSADQAEGTYKLAQGAENFIGSITIGDGSVIYGSITVNGEEFVYNGVNYSLNQVKGNLTLSVGIKDIIPPEAPTFVVSETEPTNQDVVITAVFSEDSVLKQYSINNGEWQEYVQEVIMSVNGVVAFRGIDEAGNISDVVSYEVNNIDKVAPTLEISGNATDWTNQDVILTATVSDGIVEYFDGTNWIIGDSLTVTENGNYQFRVTDEAGNVTEESVVVDKIDKVAPTLEISGNATDWTNQDVILTATVSDGIVEYFDGTNWIIGDSLTVTENGNYQFRVTDEAGNVTEESVVVDKIDKVAPDKPFVTADITAMTNQNVVVSAEFAEDAILNEYSFDGKVWMTYVKDITFENNGSIYFRSTDAAGNVSGVAEYHVDNIDKVAPTLEISGNATDWTNQDVILTATVSDGIVEYFDGTNWIIGDSLTVTENGNYQFRVTDEAGNVTEESVVVDKIDKVAPDKPFVTADITAMTNQNVVVSAEFAEDAILNEYSFDGKVWMTYVKDITFENNGSIYFRSTDAAGNVSGVAEYHVDNIDKVAPTLEISGNATDWTNQDVILTATVSDGIVEYFDGTNWIIGDSLTVTENGNYQFRVTDEAGNVTEESVVVDKIDKVAPTVLLNGIVQNENNYVISLVVDAYDNAVNGSELDYTVRYAQDINQLMNAAFVNGTVFELSASDADKKFFCTVEVKDKAGNISYSSILQFTVNDVTAPEVPSAFAKVNDESVTISWNKSSDNVGIEGYYLFLNGKKYTVYDTEFTLFDLADGRYTYNICAFDKAGNVSALSADKNFEYVKFVDTVKPEIISYNLTQGFYSYKFTVSIVAKDNYSAVKDLTYFIKYAENVTDLNTAAVIDGTSFMIDANDAGKTFFYQVGVADAAGNIAWSKASVVNIRDFTAPELNGTPTVTIDNKIVSFSWNEAYDNVAVAGYMLMIDNQKYNVANTEFSVNNISVGIHSFTLQAFDAAGNISSSYKGQFEICNPDLQFYTPDGWSDSVVISDSQSEIFTSNDKITVDWAVCNNSSTDVLNSFYVSLYVDNVLKESWFAGSLENDNVIIVNDYSVGYLSGGNHQIKLVIDSYNSVAESNENNNVYIKNITVTEIDDADDSIYEAIEVTNGTYNNAIEFSTDVDMYAVTVYAGNTVTISTSASSGMNADTYLRLYDENGMEIMCNDDISYNNKFSSLTYSFEHDGTYYFSVSTHANTAFNQFTGAGDIASETGNYAVSVSGIKNSNNLFKNAIDLGQVTKDKYLNSSMQQIADRNDIQMFKISVTAGQTVYFDVDHQNKNNSFNSYMRIFDEYGNEVAYNDNNRAPGESNSKEPYIEYTFTVGGTYYIGISSSGNNNYDPQDYEGDDSGKTTGFYTLSIGECRANDEDDQISEAGSLSIGKSVYGLISDEYDVDMYEISVSAKQTILFELSLSDLQDGYLRLFDKNGNELAFNDDTVISKDSEIEYTFSTGGKYYIGVSSVGNKKYNAVTGENDTESPLRGGYNLSARVVESNDDRYENNDSVWDAYNFGKLSGSGTVQNLKLNDSADWYTFTIDGNLAAGSMISIDFKNSQGDIELYLYKKISAGYTMIKSSCSESDNEIISIANLEAGQYALLVSPAWNGIKQSYSLTYVAEEKIAVEPTNYVVLFAGGAGVGNNHARYYYNIKNMYETLVASGIKEENIFILFADGTDPEKDLYVKTSSSSGYYINSDMSYAEGSNVYAATESNLKYIMDYMAAKVTDQDNFLFYSYDHGAQQTYDGGDFICCWDYSVSDTVFAEYVNNINAQYSTYIMAQCYSGGMLEDIILKDNMFMCSAADNSHTSHSGISYSNPEYTVGFSNAILQGLQNGIFNTFELYQYAIANNPYTDRDYPQSYGESFDIFQNLDGANSAAGYENEASDITKSEMADENIEIGDNTGSNDNSSDVNRAPDIFKVTVCDRNKNEITSIHASETITILTEAADPDGDAILKFNYYLIDENGKAEIIGIDSGFNSYIWHVAANIMPGNYRIAVTVEDIYHNESDYFVTDLEIKGIDTAPEVNGMSISAEFSTSGDTVIISGKVFDAEDDNVDSIRIYLDENNNNIGEYTDELLGVATVNSAGEWTYSFDVSDNISFGSYKLFAAAVDNKMVEHEQTFIELKVVDTSVGRIISIKDCENTVIRIYNADMTKYFTVEADDDLINIISLGSDEFICDNGSEQIAIDKFESTDIQRFEMQSDFVSDVFIGRANGVWSSCYKAQHRGNQYWAGTNEDYILTGKNKISDIYSGSDDSTLLILTDDANGDALFIDDIYTALGEQVRFSKIDEIRAGAGDDIVDMTSQRFEYVGQGVSVYGGNGDDVIWANSGENKLFGDSGNDRIVGGSGNDIIIGGIGDDCLHGGGGNDMFVFGGEFGNDMIEQLAGGKVTLCFESEDVVWNEETKSYTDGINSVRLSGDFEVEVLYGIDESLASIGAYDDFTTDKIFEDKTLIA